MFSRLLDMTWVTAAWVNVPQEPGDWSQLTSMLQCHYNVGVFRFVFLSLIMLLFLCIRLCWLHCC